MKQIKLLMDHRRWVNGKEVVFKAGNVITVTDHEYDHIVKAIREGRERNRDIAAKTPGTPEWKANRG